MAVSSKPTLTLSEALAEVITDDGHGNLAIRTVIANENRPPSDILLSNNSIDESAAIGTRIGILTVSDENAGQQQILEIISDPDNKFAIENPVTGEGINTYLVLKNTLDFTVSETHNVLIRATDDTDLSVDVLFTINVISNFRNLRSIDSNGIDEYQSGGDIHSYEINEPFSICGWFKPSSLTSTMILFSKASAAVKGYMLRANDTTGQLFLQLRSDTLRSHTFDTALTAGEWQFIAFTYAGASDISGASTYRNGVKNTTVPSGSLSGTYMSGQDFILGQRNGSFGFWNGLIDEISVWNKELTETEVNEIYNNGDLSQHSAITNLKSWYRYEDDIIPLITDLISGDNLTAVNMDSSNFSSDVHL